MTPYENDKPGPGPTATVAQADVPATSDILTELDKDLERIKQQKARPSGGIEGNVLIALCFLNDEQYVNYSKRQLGLEPQDPNKLYLTFNLIMPRFNKLMGRLTAFNGTFDVVSENKDPQGLEEAEVCEQLDRALEKKVEEVTRARERWYWMLTGGTAFEHVTWVPNSRIEPMPIFGEPGVGPDGMPTQGELMFIDSQGDPETPIPQSVRDQMIASGTPEERFEIAEEVQLTGEVGSTIYGPLNVFIDQNVRSIKDLPPDSWVHLAEFKTVGWVKENFDKDVEAAKELSLISSRIKADGAEASGGVYLKDLIPMVQGSCDENDPKMVLVVQSYQNASKSRPHGRYVCWIPKDQILHDEDNPYGEIPLVDFHFSPTTTSFWSKSYVQPLIAPQRFLNKRLSQLGEQSNATLYSTLLTGGSIKAEDIPTDFPGVIEGGLDENAAQLVQRLAPPEIPQWFLQSIDSVLKLFDDLAGGADLLSASKFPGQLRGPQAVPMLQEIIDTEWGPLFLHYGEQLARVKEMRLNRVAKFYPPTRTMHYTTRTQRDEVMTFQKDKVFVGGASNYKVSIRRGSVLPELRSLKEARLTERLSGPLAVLYMDERTGQLDKSKIAADLNYGDQGRDGRDAQFRKLSLEIIKMLWSGVQAPPVQPFYAHQPMLDELEAAMSTTEFLHASPQIQQLFSDRWQQHAQFLQQQAAQQQQAMQGQQIQSAVAQATQMAAAKAASEAVDSTRDQMSAQHDQPTSDFVRSADQQAGAARPPAPPKKRKLTVTKEESA